MTELRSGTLLEAVAELAELTGRTALDHFGRHLHVDTKGDGSPVTIADRSAEQAARTWIGSRFPDDGILGEEFGAEGDQSGRRWIIDPIDGTKSFIRGVPLWGTLVAVARGADVLAGAIYSPAVNEIVAAEMGEGCWWNGSRCRVSTCKDLASATLLITDSRFQRHPARASHWRSLADHVAVERTWGDCYGYLLVATGRAEAMVDAIMSPWDAAALVPVVREAGGVFTDWQGEVTAFGDGAIATNLALAGAVRRHLMVPWEDANAETPDA